MNIYFSKELKSLDFYDYYVSFQFDMPILKHSIGLSYVLFCMCNGINDLEKLSFELIDKFNVNSNLTNVINMILFYTIEDESIKKAFTFNIIEANHFLKINGMFGKKYPKILHIELTGTCNYACSHCYKNATYNGKYVEYDILKEKIYSKFKGVVPAIHFTGGEPTLHGKFSEIVDLFNRGYDLQLTTNGSQISSYPIEIFRNFQAIDISLYGLSEKEYAINTGNANAFELVKKGCNMLSVANIDFRVTLVINNHNWHQIEDYVRYAISVGAKSIGLSLPMQSGKLINKNVDKWYLTKETRKNIYKEFRNIQKKYSDKIKIKDWDRSEYSSMWKSYPADNSLRCGAGKNSWWMSEKYTFRPCSFLPDQYMDLDYDTWYSYITNEKEIDWTKARNSLELFASDNGLNIVDFCSVFRK